MFLAAVEAVIKDEGFTVPSPLAVNAVKCATELLKWSHKEDNRGSLDNLASKLATTLESAIFSSIHLKVQREKMWGQYHAVRSSEHFQEFWSEVLQNVQGCNTCPIFYQFVTDHVFRKLLRLHFPVNKLPDTAHNSSPLTNEEASALRYAAGYVCRAMKKKYQSNPELLECVDELTDDSSEDGDHFSSEWTKVASRGGLLYIKDTVYFVFQAMEMVVRQYFLKERADKLGPGTRDILIKNIMEDEDVNFHWCMVAVDMEDSFANTLLHDMVKQWVTIRGFAFTSSWIELYKQDAQKSLQCSKGLRKTLRTH